MCVGPQTGCELSQGFGVAPCCWRRRRASCEPKPLQNALHCWSPLLLPVQSQAERSEFVCLRQVNEAGCAQRCRPLSTWPPACSASSVLCSCNKFVISSFFFVMECSFLVSECSFVLLCEVGGASLAHVLSFSCWLCACGAGGEFLYSTGLLPIVFHSMLLVCCQQFFFALPPRGWISASINCSKSFFLIACY